MPKIQTTRIYAEIEKAKKAGYTTVSAQGSARCLGKGTLIRMYDGKLKAVEDIVEGDKIMDIDGKTYNTVVETHRGVDMLYRVHQTRGLDYIVNSRHILSLKQTWAKQHKVAIPGYKSAEKRKIELLPFDSNIIHDFPIDYFIHQSGNFQCRYTGFKNTLIMLPYKMILIDPYYLGLWLGDGCSVRPHEITNIDKEVISYFYEFAKTLDSYAYRVDKVTNRIQICEEGKRNTALRGKTREFRNNFRKYNLIGNKHIPEEYIYNSYEVRLKILAGLIDTDGCKTGRNTYSITQKRREILEGVEEICHLSGFYTNGIIKIHANMKRKDGTIYHSIAYSIEINHNDFKDLNKYIRIKRKRTTKNCKRNYFSSSISITSDGIGEYFGFTLDNSPYFLLRDGTVCHNSSKTYNIVIWLVMQCYLHPHTTVSIVRATLPALKGSVLRDFEEIMVNHGLWNRKNFNKSELIYTFDNGSWIEFFSSDDEQKLRGRKRKILYVNEGNELRFIEWQQLQMRTTEFSIIDYNPSFSDDHWLCTLNQEPSTYHFITTYKDNPFLEEKVINELESLKDKNPSLWRVYGLGLQAIIEGLIFKNVEVIEEIPRWAKKHRFLGLDFGYSNDPTACEEVCIYGNAIYIDEKFYRTHMLSDEISNEIKKVIKEEKFNFEVISESADPRLIDEIENTGIDIKPVSKYQGSVNAGVTEMLKYKIYITKRSLNGRKEFKNYTYRQNKEGKWLNEPVDAFNHLIDGVRYVILEKILGQNDDSLDADDIADII